EAFRAEHPDLALESIDLVVKYGDQRKLANVKTHVRRAPLPERSFYRLDDNVYVASPELCLMQLASKLTEPQVVKLALEMCGTYALDPIDPDNPFEIRDLPDASSGMSKRPPLTSATRIKAYAKRLFSQNSRARSAHYLRYVVDGSASPRETALCMLLCMPPRFGGYGLALPELNHRVKLSLSDQLMVGAHHFDCDLYWAHPRVGVEYDSKQHHTAAEKQERDATRRNMLQYKGVQVIVATRTQVNKPGEFDKLAHQIGRAIGKRFRTPEQYHVEARSSLRKTLFDWDAIPVRNT
ncbi:MAG: hypothetical protein IJ087_18405, partial [Eggerthellaceae bacterium]|nr:hypothetical protein [Eggerthellaceae bacterium]